MCIYIYTNRYEKYYAYMHINMPYTPQGCGGFPSQDGFVQPHHSEILKQGWQGEAGYLCPGAAEGRDASGPQQHAYSRGLRYDPVCLIQLKYQIPQIYVKLIGVIT